MVAVRSWGRLSAHDHAVRALRRSDLLPPHDHHTSGPALAFGKGRSYGDVCLNPGGLLYQTTGLDRFVSFDPATGLLVCEAGVLLRDIQRRFVPSGWMLPVTPGTQMVTVGGAIANDVHGKNHHAFGTFGHHVRRLRLLRSDGETIECGPDERPEWFAATMGGMGLTGVVAEASIALRRIPGPWIASEKIAFAGLDEFFALSDQSEAEWEHAVAWIDCSAPSVRGMFARGNHAAGDDVPEAKAPRRMPFTPPFSLVNSWTLRPFNTAYFHLQTASAGAARIHYEPFLYPLDNLIEWNRMYGRRGFYQYQSVVPRDVARDATHAMLKAIARSGQGSFLAVLKTFGDRPSPGLMSFPRPGVTLALDFANRGPDTERLFARLDDIVREAGGRLYAAKDARMPRDLFRSGYPERTRFLPFRDPGISSAMSRRLMDW